MSGWVASLIVHTPFGSRKCRVTAPAFELVSFRFRVNVRPTKRLLGLGHPAPLFRQAPNRQSLRGIVARCAVAAEGENIPGPGNTDGDPTMAIPSSNRHWRRSCCAGVDGVASRTHDGEATSRRHRRWPAHSMRRRAR
jgi:hypothetical protein